MNILYDGEIFTMQPYGGINRYFTELINHLPLTETPILSTAIRRDAIFPSHPNLKVIYYPRFGFSPGRVSYGLERYYFRTRRFLERPDIEHPTFYRQLTRQPIKRRRAPVVITVYDLLHLSFPEQLDPRHDWAPEIAHAVCNADAIIAISESTKRDLVDRLQIPQERITVIGLASSLNLADHKNNESSLAVPSTPPYFLFVGARGGYKNFDLALCAFAQIVGAHPTADLRLQVAGAAFTHDELIRVSELGIEKRVTHLGEVSDQQLASLLSHSIALLYPSRHEGFGLPALEALDCGTTVIAANCSSLPEVVGPGGILINPESVTDLASAMDSLISNEALRSALIDAGTAHSRKFSWERTAEETMKLYRSLQ